MFTKITALENLLEAYYLSKKDNHYKLSTIKFDFHLEENLGRLRWLLSNGYYWPLAYNYFIHCDSKKRNIAAPDFRDRVVQRALVRQIEPLFEKGFIYDSYACRKNKGTHFGAKRLKKFLKSARSVNGKNKKIYVFRSDIQKYFPSISWDILFRLIRKKINNSFVLELIRRLIVFHRVLQPDKASLELFRQSISLKKRCGLPIGNLTSQLFANIYLNELDHFVKEKLRCRWYGRYMDDFFIISSDKEKLKIYRKEIEQFLRKRLRLRFHQNKTVIQNVSQGVPFVGYRIFYDHILVRQKTLIRMSRKYKARKKQLEKGLISQKDFQSSRASLYGHLKFADTYNLRKYFFPAIPSFSPSSRFPLRHPDFPSVIPNKMRDLAKRK